CLVDDFNGHGAPGTAQHPAPDVDCRRFADAAANGVFEIEPVQTFVERRESNVGKFDQCHEAKTRADPSSVPRPCCGVYDKGFAGPGLTMMSVAIQRQRLISDRGARDPRNDFRSPRSLLSDNGSLFIETVQRI